MNNQYPQASYYTGAQEEFPAAKFDRPTNNLKVMQLILTPTGTYNQQFSRPWATDYNMDNVNEIHNVLSSSYYDHQKKMQAGIIRPDQNYTLTPELVACASSSFIKPSSNYEAPIVVPGGWNEQRCSFVMHVQVDSPGLGTQVYVMTGYTDGMGLSVSGNIAPDMMFYINAVYETGVQQRISHAGVENILIMKNASQILSNEKFTGNIDAGYQTRMRPQDVIGAINVSHIDELSNGSVEVVDIRSRQTDSPAKSNFNHANPNNYLASILGGLIAGEELAKAQNRHSQAFDLGMTAVADHTVNRDPFMKAMQSIRGSAATNKFSMRDLKELDFNADSDYVCKVVWRDRPEVIASARPGDDAHVAGMTQGWHGADRPTQVATMIANTMPSLMSSLMIGTISIHATNRGPGGVPFMMHSMLDPLIKGTDVSTQAEALKQQFQTHLLNDITYGNQIAYTLDVTASLLGDIWISMHLGDYAPVDYVMPTYANSMMTPVVTRNRQNLNELAGHFSELKNNSLGQSAEPSVSQFFLPSGNKY